MAIFVFAAPGARADTAPAVARGTAWLTAQVQADGSVASTQNASATALQAAAEAARTLRLAGQSHLPLQTWIAAQDDATTEMLARRLLALSGDGASNGDLVTGLLERQGTDGGFGALPGYPSNALDTAFALAALPTAQSAAQARAAAFLLSAQKSNGAYAVAANPDNAYLTALVSTALQRTDFGTAAKAAVDRANAWLISTQRADGNWESLTETALAKLALAGTSSDSALYATINAALLAGQGQDGSWSGDPYLTALALRALMTGPAPTPVPAPTTGKLRGRLVDGATAAAVVGATLTVVAPGGPTAMTDAQGVYTFNDLPPGAYTLTVNAKGFAAATLAVSIKAGADTDAGTVALAPLSSEATVSGTIKAADTGLPIVGAMVVMSGASSGSVYTGADGNYKLVAMTPGTITLVVSRTGYQSATANATAAAGTLVNFSPNLVAVPTEATLSGRIVDGTSGAPLAGVSVRIGSLNRATLTDATGAFVLAQLPAGAARVDLVLSGYAAQSFSIVIEAGTQIDAQTLRLQKTTPPATTGTISGTVTAAASGAPLAGVTIEVQGSAKLSTLSAADGSYAFANVVPGSVTLNALKAGYVAAGGTGELTAGATLIFSPKLTASATPSVRGRVVDNLTLAPLANARITLDQTDALTDADGRFSFDSVTSGNHILSFSAPGYLTFTQPLATDGSSAVDLQVRKLAKSTAPMSLAGKITDLANGKGIANATVAVLDTSLVAKTGADGSYRLEGVLPGSVSLRIAAVGYTSETMIVDLSPYNPQSIDRALQVGQDASLALAFETDRTTYPAYAEVAMRAHISNNGTTSMSATASLAIFDAEDNYIASFAVSSLDTRGDTTTRFQFAPGDNLVNLTWNTAAFAPGRYRAVLKVHQDANGTDGGPVVLAQRQTLFDIEATAAIGSVRLTPLPAYSHLGADEALAYRLEVANRSNVPVSATLHYQLLSPQQSEVDAGTVALDLLPAESSRVQSIQGPHYRFQASGNYPLTLSAVAGTAPASLAPGVIAVAPATRITPTQNVSPAVVVPDGDQRIHVELRLIGVQEK